MSYQEIKPSRFLTAYIDSYWLFHNADEAAHEMPILPDCCMDIIYDMSKDEIFICGVMTTARTITIRSGQEFFGIRFMPGVLPAMLNVSANDLRDQDVPLAHIDRALHEKIASLRDAHSLKEMSRLCDTIFEREIGREAERAHEVVRVFQATQAAQSPGHSVRDLSRKMNVGMRRLERLFSRYIGITPKRFLKIQRFQNLHANLQKKEIGLASLSLQSGYADQSHMNKEYRQLTSETPTSRNMSHFYKN